MLDRKDEKFAQEVVVTGGNLVVAFQASGWAWEKYSTDELSILAWEKSNHPEIAKRIKELQEKPVDNKQQMFNNLQPLQQKVVINVLAGMSNIDAYYAADGKAKTKRAAEASVSQILSNRKVSAYLDIMKQEAVTSAIMSRTEMLERLSNLSRVNTSDIVEWHVVRNDAGEPTGQAFWSIKESAEQDPYVMASISEVTAGKDGFKIKQHSPLAAMKQLADLGGYNKPQKIEQSGMVTTVQMTKEEYAKVRKQMLEKDDC